MRIKPLASRVLVRPFPSDEISEGGIIVPENARGRSNKATVVATGECSKYKVDDIVFHVKEAGTEIHEAGIAYWLINDVDILCTLVDVYDSPRLDFMVADEFGQWPPKMPSVRWSKGTPIILNDI